MRARFIIAGCLVLACAGTAMAECACVWGGPFTQVQAETDLVVAATVVSTSGNSVDVVLDQMIRGREFDDRLRIWMHTGDLCRPDAKRFPPGSQWVFALDRIEAVPTDGFNPRTPNISYGRVDDYSLSSCGGYWLSRSEDVVTGNLAGGPRWVHDPEMSPVLLDLVVAYVEGRLDTAALVEASTVDPELQRLRLETRSFLRQQRSAHSQ
jgi:hypothetical protein